MVSNVMTCSERGGNVSIAVHVGPGLPSFTVVGAPDGRCRAIRDRVRGALVSLGWEWPLQRITVSVVPGHALWPGMDLPIALGILDATGQQDLPPGVMVGTLGLDGSCQPPSSVLRRNLPSGVV